MEFRTWSALPLVIALALGGCSSKPEDKAAAPFADALATLGLDGVTYERAHADPRGIRLANVRATLDGKPVEIAEIRGDGFVPTAEGWSADRILASRVEGGISAEEISLVAAKGPGASGRGPATYGGLKATSLRTRLMGLPVRVARFDRTGAAEAVAVEVEGLRIEDGFTGPSPVLGLLGGVDWRGRLHARSDARAGLSVDVVELMSTRGVVRGRIVLDGLGADPVGRLPAADLNVLLQPSSWSEGVSIREAMLSGSARGPFPASLTRMSPDDYADPYVKAIVTAVLGMAAEGGIRGELVAMPPASVRLRSLGQALARDDAAGALGLSARIEGVPPRPVMGIGPGRSP